MRACLIMISIAAVIVVACAGAPVTTIGTPTSNPATHLATVGARPGATLIASPTAEPPTPAPSATPIVTASPVAAGADLCPVTLKGNDFGPEFDQYGELDFGDTQNPNPGWVSGREFAWGTGTETDFEGFRGRIECYDSSSSAQATYDRVTATVICVDGEGREVDGTSVTLPVRLGDVSSASFCPGFDGPDSPATWGIEAFARVDDATVYFLWNSTSELQPDADTVDRFAGFAKAFLTTAAEQR